MPRRNAYDVIDRVDTTDVAQVCAEVCRIHRDLFQKDVSPVLRQAFSDFASLYGGDEAHYHACDTEYHDIQHVLDVTLAMARMMDGAARSRYAKVITERLYVFGIVTALYHDAGYLRRRGDTRHKRGAEYTRTHVSRGSLMLKEYFARIGMADLAGPAARVIHFTGYEMPVADIRVEQEFRLIGNLLGSADLLAQMADRCYLEKCYDRLYPEFVYGGLARQQRPDGRVEVVYGSGTELIYKTKAFSESVAHRLEHDLGGDHRLVERHFGGEHVYWDEVQKNVRHAERITAAQDVGLLRRQPPVTLKTVTGDS